ncbi:MAG: multidrug ABC transporter substrate-binding protein [Deltaproteobacteria bacterium HGW-Deltaproteobacteria-22]|jgi:putative ABC transport system permease protein|nr:MAG: multidrug ABC transporter substrate-binding protein [Deltaproteobacteria bacterium HGW-Deltaproteobacteria-22]
MIWNTLLLSLRAILRNLMRSFLTILGIVIGVAAVITMVTLGNGATRAVSDQIASMGANQLMVVPGQMMGPGSEGAQSFKIADVSAIRSQITSARAVAPVVNKSETVVFQARNWSTSIVGTSNDYFVVGGWTLAGGRTFSELEERGGRAVCVIGETVREKLFQRENPVGGEIRIRTFSCQVIGLLKAKGQAAMGQDQDDTVIMPLRTVQRRITGNKDIKRIMVSVKDGASIDSAKSRLVQLLRERRRLGPNEDDDFRVMDTRQLAETVTGTTKILTMLLGAVAAVSLLVGGIGIMNIMLVSVTERTREIGTRLAIGALENEVLLQFLIEAVMLSGLGGLIGILLGNGASVALSGVMGVPYVFDSNINLMAFVFSAFIGVLFGYFPARRAARLNPIDALRYE